MSKKNKAVRHDLDIVIPVYGRIDLLKECVSALENQSYPYNLIIVDNNSPKDSGADEYYNTIRDRVTILQQTKNLGFGKACNLGASRSNGKQILFLNSDCIVQPNVLKRTVEELLLPGVGLVGLKLLFPHDLKNLDSRIRASGLVQHVGVSINIRGQVHHPFVGWDTFHKKVNAQQGKDVWAVTGAYFLTHRVIYKQIGGFDPLYGLGTYEDIDYSMAVHKLQKEVRIVTDVFAYHYVGATSETYQIQYPINENHEKFMKKWQGTAQLQWSDWVYL